MKTDQVLIELKMQFEVDWSNISGTDIVYIGEIIN